MLEGGCDGDGGFGIPEDRSDDLGARSGEEGEVDFVFQQNVADFLAELGWFVVEPVGEEWRCFGAEMFEGGEAFLVCGAFLCREIGCCESCWIESVIEDGAEALAFEDGVRWSGEPEVKEREREEEDERGEDDGGEF